MNILEEANNILNNNEDPHRKYGGIIESLEETAKIASVLLRKEITAKDIVVIYISGKLNREAHNHKKDNLVDAVGYIEMLNKVQENEENKIIIAKKKREEKSKI